MVQILVMTFCFQLYRRTPLEKAVRLRKEPDLIGGVRQEAMGKLFHWRECNFRQLFFLATSGLLNLSPHNW